MNDLKTTAYEALQELTDMAAGSGHDHIEGEEARGFQSDIIAYLKHLESPTYAYNETRCGTLAIHPGDEITEPCLVLVRHRNNLDQLVLQVINKTTIELCRPDAKTLLDYDPQLLERLLAEWHVENARTVLKRREKALTDLNRT